jgi:radical SAM superfamily enzyme YgiQ (UPF0313 family)
VDSFSMEVAKVVAGPGRHAITFAPEAGSQRLRLVINKRLTDEDVLQAAEVAFSCGWTGLKLYFMVGLPTETPEDIQGIVQLAAQVKEIGRRYHRARARVRVSTSTFIPKPHSSFQWARQNTAEELAPKHDLLRRGCKRAGVELAWEDPEGSLLEAVLSRGDRRLGRAILRAWHWAVASTPGTSTWTGASGSRPSPSATSTPPSTPTASRGRSRSSLGPTSTSESARPTCGASG